MPKLTYTKNSIGAIAKRAEEGFILTKKEQEAYQFIVITSKQMMAAAEAVGKLAQSYEEAAKSVTGMVQKIMEQQQQFAKQLKKLFEGVAAFQQIYILIQMPRTTIPTVDHQSELVRIFVQPDEPNIIHKPLPSPKRKYELPPTAVKIIGKGFTAEGKYISGITRKSEVGRTFELFIRSDFKEAIPDKAIDEIIGIGPYECGYEARDRVIGDLKKILMKQNKLKLNIKRDRAIGQYIDISLTQYIRKPRKAKQKDMTRKIN
ncbi:hypothetical protein B6D29_03195 [Microgenomates bacterium UTCPR1]|nr:MAG: hypothetical protein B6D29_03195 [Microgenomates bacterium UTCPR1]